MALLHTTQDIYASGTDGLETCNVCSTLHIQGLTKLGTVVALLM